MVRQVNPSTESGGKQPYQQNRVYSADGISPALCSSRPGHAPIVILPGDILRRMTPYRVRKVADNPRMVHVGMLCDATVQNVGQRLDGRGNKAHSIIPKNIKDDDSY